METTVTRNVERKRFEATTDDGRLAGFAEYETPREGVLEFTHTVVRDEFEGQGIGSKLARAALEEARTSSATVIPTCPFIKGWIDKHPDYRDLLA